MNTYERICNYEKKLHPLAQKSDLAERKEPLYDERYKTACRSLFGRDRDRIIFCSPFRRLMHKTQLYVSFGLSEHNRTRLTHTVEVVQISRAIAKGLNMNEELVEAIAYGHDIGHAPFGHAGERLINGYLNGQEAMPHRLTEMAGKQLTPIKLTNFKHNFQSVRILNDLEIYHTYYNGLNLTYTVLEGILKHTSIYMKDTISQYLYPDITDNDNMKNKLFLNNEFSISVEGQIVAIADEIAQVTHDINDALRMEMLKIEDITKFDEIKKVFSDDKTRIPLSNIKPDFFNAQIMPSLLNHFIVFVINEMQPRLEKLSKGKNFDKSNIILENWILKSKDKINDPAFNILKQLKHEVVLNSFYVIRMDNKGLKNIRKLFDEYLTNILQVPDSVLDNYFEHKNIETKHLDLVQFSKSIKGNEIHFDIKNKLTDKDIEVFYNFIIGKNEKKRTENSFRLLSYDLIKKLQPHFAIDSIFLRSIADHISGMTDFDCQKEANEF
ncbi:MAG: dNTP triphosphohydrolase [Nitrospirae bacterium]|nr:dNTP triphosphohydrolase [Nitrospirota bacterium]MBF0541203.1 dNTP triphosphohydrolase [Nitrospirota bacterium]